MKTFLIVGTLLSLLYFLIVGIPTTLFDGYDGVYYEDYINLDFIFEYIIHCLLALIVIVLSIVVYIVNSA